MKSFVSAVTVLSALAGSALAQPTPQTVTVALSNDQFGNFGAAQIPLDGSIVRIADAYANTNINQGGVFDATSAQLTAGIGLNPYCTIEFAPGQFAGALNAQQTFVKFGSPAMLTEFDFAQGTISCST